MAKRGQVGIITPTNFRRLTVAYRGLKKPTPIFRLKTRQYFSKIVLYYIMEGNIMILQIRGTSGTGKSTLVRAIFDKFENVEPYYIDGRKRPWAMLCRNPNGKDIAVLGHYETACGGCDTIAKDTRNTVFRLVREWHHQDYHVIFEGLILTLEYQRSKKLHEEGYPFKIISIEIPLQECLDSVNARRRIKNPNAWPVKPDNTINFWHANTRTVKKLVNDGVWCFSGNRVETTNKAFELLGI